MAPVVSLIVAMAENGVIGREGSLPWHLGEDLKRFKATTMGKPILMGRKTYESIGRALPGRMNIVLTRDEKWSAPGVVAVRSVAEALALAGEAAELMVIGGAQVYRSMLPRARRIYLTQLHAQIEGDTYFPAFDRSQWREVERDAHPADENNTHPVSFVRLERAAPAPARG